MPNQQQNDSNILRWYQVRFLMPMRGNKPRCTKLFFRASGMWGKTKQTNKKKCPQYNSLVVVQRVYGTFIVETYGLTSEIAIYFQYPKTACLLALIVTWSCDRRHCIYQPYALFCVANLAVLNKVYCNYRKFVFLMFRTKDFGGLYIFARNSSQSLIFFIFKMTPTSV